MSFNTHVDIDIGAKIGVLEWFDVRDSHFPRSAMLAVGSREEEVNQMYVYRVSIVEQETSDSKIEVRFCGSHSYESEGEVISLNWLGDSFADGKILAAGSNGRVFLHKKLSSSSSSSSSPPPSPSPTYSSDLCLDHGGKLTCVDTFTTGAKNGAVTVATAGEDSGLKIWDLHQAKVPVYQASNVDPIGIRGATFLWDSNQFCTVGTTLKAWDLRAPPTSLIFEHLPVLDDIKRSYHQHSATPNPHRASTPNPHHPTPNSRSLAPYQRGPPPSSFTTTSPTPALTCVAPHSSSKNLVVTGDEEGNVIGWDIRKQKYPVFWGQCSNAPIWDIKFHPTFQRTFYTCGEDGLLVGWMLKDGGVRSLSTGQSGNDNFVLFPRMGNYSTEVISRSSLPLHSLDVYKAHQGLGILLAGGEAESLSFRFEIKEENWR